MEVNMDTTLVVTAAESAVTTPRKRNCEGEIVSRSCDTAPNTSESDLAHKPSRQQSPAPSDSTSELTELTSTGIASPALNKIRPIITHETSSNGPTPAKKRKLTFAEREVEKAVRQREKEETARQKAEEKALKEEEKRQKDEEKRKKEEEKEISKRTKEIEKAEKDKIRDAKKQEKEAERAKKDAEKKDKELEKLKKDRTQMRIGAFFGRPSAQSTPPTTLDDASSRTSSRRSSIAAIDVSEPILKAATQKPPNTEFDKYIIPYFVHDHTELAPTNRFKVAQPFDIFSNLAPDHILDENINVEPLRTRFRPAKKRMRTMQPVKEIAEHLQATRINTADVTGDYNPVAYAPYKILSFREDIRPPYIGTYTKHINPTEARKICRRSAYRGRPDTNYDYDSEAEWEEPAADDEEILDDEMSESEDGDEDMQDFLDDENDQGRRRMFAGAMEPISSGLCFEGETYNSGGHKLDDYRIDVLHDSTTFPIDPFSTTHWSDIGKMPEKEAKHDSIAQAKSLLRSEIGNKSMLPPRTPLATVSTPNTLNGYLAPGNTIVVSQNENEQIPSKQRGRPANPNKELKMIAPELMDAFKRSIDGSDLTKAGLIEILKKQFPKCSKDAIKDTLGVVAIRVGKKEVEKKWALV